MEITLLRIAQEALTNVARHAKTEEAKISLDRTDYAVHLTVQDGGIGMNGYESKTHPQSHGLKIMRERAEAFGGNVTIKSAPGEGTTVDAVLPIEEQGPG
jgi:signal transduction histidine kinase